jgi:hypothetical protein
MEASTSSGGFLSSATSGPGGGWLIWTTFLIAVLALSCVIALAVMSQKSWLPGAGRTAYDDPDFTFSMTRTTENIAPGLESSSSNNFTQDEGVSDPTLGNIQLIWPKDATVTPATTNVNGIVTFPTGPALYQTFGDVDTASAGTNAIILNKQGWWQLELELERYTWQGAGLTNIGLWSTDADGKIVRSLGIALNNTGYSAEVLRINVRHQFTKAETGVTATFTRYVSRPWRTDSVSLRGWHLH